MKTFNPCLLIYRQVDLLVHTGNLTQYNFFENIIDTGSIFQTTSDTEVILQLVARSESKNIRQINGCFNQHRGAFSLLL